MCMYNIYIYIFIFLYVKSNNSLIFLCVFIGTSTSFEYIFLKTGGCNWNSLSILWLSWSPKKLKIYKSNLVHINKITNKITNLDMRIRLMLVKMLLYLFIVCVVVTSVNLLYWDKIYELELELFYQVMLSNWE